MKVYYFMLTWHGRLHLYVYDLSTWHKVPHNYLILCNDTRIDIIAWPNFSWLLLCIFFFMGQNSINNICFTLLFVNVYLIFGLVLSLLWFVWYLEWCIWSLSPSLWKMLYCLDEFKSIALKSKPINAIFISCLKYLNLEVLRCSYYSCRP